MTTPAPDRIPLPPPSPAQTKQLPLGGTTDIVTTMRMGEGGQALRYLRHNVYIRLKALEGQFRADTTHLGYPVQDQAIVVPILRWWDIGSAMDIPSTGVAHLAAIWGEPDLLTEWDGSSTLLELGGPVTVLPHGYSHVGQFLSFHYELHEVHESTRAGRTLRDTPKAP